MCLRAWGKIRGKCPRLPLRIYCISSSAPGYRITREPGHHGARAEAAMVDFGKEQMIRETGLAGTMEVPGRSERCPISPCLSVPVRATVTATPKPNPRSYPEPSPGFDGQQHEPLTSARLDWREEFQKARHEASFETFPTQWL
ncbi:hypothetical protein K469DRAFT_10562 [Zopfia rhizophila CBS 207.26]|uniref:Uncharacterized protein n=1 Tax=Zopfia rhizophila CBS 207.26 TaxID=1314779 RepID=A0A6A6EVU3_9PEZI|nr:hypothetical protein K469DRAFT_10562 [Zopfia rhizophila CBS 207.26]